MRTARTRRFPEADAALRAELDALLADVTKDMEDYRVYLAAEKVYHYAWHRLADEILEESKKLFAGGGEDSKLSRKALLRSLLADVLKALQPLHAVRN